jgi:hypothetical protein
MCAAYVDQRRLRLVKLPARGQEAAVLVAVRITEHHFLGPAAALQQPHVDRQAEQGVHGLATVAQVGDGLEQRDDVQIERAFMWTQQPGLLQHERHFQQVRDPCRLGYDVVREAKLSMPVLKLACGAQNGKLGGCFLRVGDVGRGERPRRGEFRDQQFGAGLLVQTGIVRARLGCLEQLGDDPLMDLRVLPQVDRGEV